MINPLKAHEGRIRMQQFRHEWSAFGFKDTSNMIHVDDRPLVRAYIELLRADRLFAMANSDDVAAQEFVASRNMPRSPDGGEMAEVSPDPGTLAASLITQGTRHYKNARKYQEAATRSGSVQEEALMIAALHQSAASFKYAKAIWEAGK